jgi:hypothetical protein
MTNSTFRGRGGRSEADDHLSCTRQVCNDETFISDSSRRRASKAIFTVNWRIAIFRLDEAQSHVQLPVPTGVRTPKRGAFCALWN